MSKALDNITKLSEIVSAAEPRFGIDLTGATDAATAVAAAINALSAGQEFRLPRGAVLLCESQITISAAGVKVSGLGARFVKSGSFSGGVIRVAAVDVELEDFEIDGSDRVVDGVITSSAVAAGLRCLRLTIHGTNYGLSTVSNDDIVIDGCHIYDTANYSIRAHNITAAAALSGVRVTNCKLDRSGESAATLVSGCLLVRGAVGMLTTDVDVSGNRMLLPEAPTNSSALACEMRYVSGTFDHNRSKDGSMLVSVALSDEVTVSANVCDGANFYAIEIAGISPTGCNNITVTGNSINGRGRLLYGVGAQGTSASAGLTIGNNAIRGTLQYGVFVNAQWTDVTVTGNRVLIDSVSASQYGIYTTGPANGLTVTGNVLNGDGVGEKAIYLLDVSNATVGLNVTKGWTQNDVFLHSVAGIDGVTLSGNTLGSGLAANAIGTTGAGAIANVRGVANTGYRLSNTERADIIDLTNAVFDVLVAATPESAVTAGVGSLARRRNGGASTTLYIKESGAGNTGWVGK